MSRKVSDGLIEARSLNRGALALALVIGLAVVGLEIAGGIFTNSLALLADAGHMVSDVLAISIAIFAIWLANRPASAQQTFGYHRAEVLAAAANGILLLLVAAFVFWQAAQRFSDPPDVSSRPMLIIGVIGLAANVASAVILHRRQGQSINVRGAFYHVLGDVAGSVGVIVAGVIMLATGWLLADPLVSVVIGLLIVFGAVRLLRESLTVLLETVPSYLDTVAIERALTETEGVVGLHDLHVWTVTSGLVALSCHCELSGDRDSDQVLAELCDMLHDRFAIHHVTIQPEVKKLHGGGGDHSLPRCTSELGHEHRPAELASTER